MRRRTLLFGLAGTGALAACGSEAEIPGVTKTKVPILASTTASTLAPQSVTKPYTPAPGTAPAQAFAVGKHVYADFNRGADRPLPTTLWYPAAGTAPATGPAPADDAAPATGRFPLILFSHGLTSQPDDYAEMLARWAQSGFVVAGPSYPHTHYQADGFDENDIVNQPADATSVIDQLLGLDPADPVRAVIDPDRIAAAGHSAGGITTVGLFSAHRDPRLKAGVVLAGTDFQAAPFTGAPAAMLFIHGRQDTTVHWEAGHTVFEAVPWSRAMLTITDGGHVTDAASFEATTQTSTQFLWYALWGDPTAKAAIPTAAATGAVATLEDQL